jgi:hypothetical protein
MHVILQGGFLYVATSVFCQFPRELHEFNIYYRNFTVIDKFKLFLLAHVADCVSWSLYNIPQICGVGCVVCCRQDVFYLQFSARWNLCSRNTFCVYMLRHSVAVE